MDTDLGQDEKHRKSGTSYAELLAFELPIWSDQSTIFDDDKNTLPQICWVAPGFVVENLECIWLLPSKVVFERQPIGKISNSARVVGEWKCLGGLFYNDCAPDTADLLWTARQASAALSNCALSSAIYLAEVIKRSYILSSEIPRSWKSVLAAHKSGLLDLNSSLLAVDLIPAKPQSKQASRILVWRRSGNSSLWFELVCQSQICLSSKAKLFTDDYALHLMLAGPDAKLYYIPLLYVSPFSPYSLAQLVNVIDRSGKYFQILKKIFTHTLVESLNFMNACHRPEDIQDKSRLFNLSPKTLPISLPDFEDQPSQIWAHQILFLSQPSISNILQMIKHAYNLLETQGSLPDNQTFLQNLYEFSICPGTLAVVHQNGSVRLLLLTQTLQYQWTHTLFTGQIQQFRFLHPFICTVDRSQNVSIILRSETLALSNHDQPNVSKTFANLLPWRLDQTQSIPPPESWRIVKNIANASHQIIKLLYTHQVPSPYNIYDHLTHVIIACLDPKLMKLKLSILDSKYALTELANWDLPYLGDFHVEDFVLMSAKRMAVIFESATGQPELKIINLDLKRTYSDVDHHNFAVILTTPPQIQCMKYISDANSKKFDIAVLKPQVFPPLAPSNDCQQIGDIFTAVSHLSSKVQKLFDLGDYQTALSTFGRNVSPISGLISLFNLVDLKSLGLTDIQALDTPSDVSSVCEVEAKETENAFFSTGLTLLFTKNLEGLVWKDLIQIQRRVWREFVVNGNDHGTLELIDDEIAFLKASTQQGFGSDLRRLAEMYEQGSLTHSLLDLYGAIIGTGPNKSLAEVLVLLLLEIYLIRQDPRRFDYVQKHHDILPPATTSGLIQAYGDNDLFCAYCCLRREIAIDGIEYFLHLNDIPKALEILKTIFGGKDSSGAKPSNQLGRLVGRIYTEFPEQVFGLEDLDKFLDINFTMASSATSQMKEDESYTNAWTRHHLRILQKQLPTKFCQKTHWPTDVVAWVEQILEVLVDCCGGNIINFLKAILATQIETESIVLILSQPHYSKDILRGLFGVTCTKNPIVYKYLDPNIFNKLARPIRNLIGWLFTVYSEKYPSALDFSLLKSSRSQIFEYLSRSNDATSGAANLLLTPKILKKSIIKLISSQHPDTEDSTVQSIMALMCVSAGRTEDAIFLGKRFHREDLILMAASSVKESRDRLWKLALNLLDHQSHDISLLLANSIIRPEEFLGFLEPNRKVHPVVETTSAELTNTNDIVFELSKLYFTVEPPLGLSEFLSVFGQTLKSGSADKFKMALWQTILESSNLQLPPLEEQVQKLKNRPWTISFPHAKCDICLDRILTTPSYPMNDNLNHQQTQILLTEKKILANKILVPTCGHRYHALCSRTIAINRSVDASIIKYRKALLLIHDLQNALASAGHEEEAELVHALKHRRNEALGQLQSFLASQCWICAPLIAITS